MKIKKCSILSIILFILFSTWAVGYDFHKNAYDKFSLRLKKNRYIDYNSSKKVEEFLKEVESIIPIAIKQLLNCPIEISFKKLDFLNELPRPLSSRASHDNNRYQGR